ncbi:hypothetical protein [Yinghuangia soli]|uniref:Uncharacterized protein n=1 Tax=Yinghuangia soli TaxID=2908204 RepID=A0AA41Q7D4_9ACTN|nr:hypothetical protein [Yinghuangia soli]MCF2532295.1 hypothetical protein [Yinghuangia soli]
MTDFEVTSQYLRDSARELTDALLLARKFVPAIDGMKASVDDVGSLSVRAQVHELLEVSRKAMVGLVQLGENVGISLLFAAQQYDDAEAEATRLITQPLGALTSTLPPGAALPGAGDTQPPGVGP